MGGSLAGSVKNCLHLPAVLAIQTPQIVVSSVILLWLSSWKGVTGPPEMQE